MPLCHCRETRNVFRGQNPRERCIANPLKPDEQRLRHAAVHLPWRKRESHYAVVFTEWQPSDTAAYHQNVRAQVLHLGPNSRRHGEIAHDGSWSKLLGGEKRLRRIGRREHDVGGSERRRIDLHLGAGQTRLQMRQPTESRRLAAALGARVEHVEPVDVPIPSNEGRGDFCKPAPECFREQDVVWRDAKRFAREERAGPTHSARHASRPATL
jgi:hypothetical protein